jgi:hypothetical protein
MKLNSTLFFSFLGVVFFSSTVFASTMQSESYTIQNDSLNAGGNEQSSSSNYKNRDTIGEIATEESVSESFVLRAGYRQMQEVMVILSSPLDVTMLPDIGGVGGGTSDGSVQWIATTDGTAGYSLSIKADVAPALVSGGNSFADYTPTGVNPDFDWSINAANSEFGFTAEGDDIVQKYRDEGGVCNTGTGNAPDKCWSNLSTSDEQISSASLPNHPGGSSTTIKFRAESGTSHVQAEGVYQATITVTAVAN